MLLRSPTSEGHPLAAYPTLVQDSSTLLLLLRARALSLLHITVGALKHVVKQAVIALRSFAPSRSG